MTKPPAYINDPDAIVYAAYDGEYDLVRSLLERGDDVNVKTELGESALLAATTSGYLGIVEVLLENGADVNAEDVDGTTAMDVAASRNYDDFCVLLRKYGAEERYRATLQIPGGGSPTSKQYRVDEDYLDDRMFVLEVRHSLSGSAIKAEHQETWSVITCRNVRGYPPFRIDPFNTQAEAVRYLRKVAPQSPRVSLNGSAPFPVPSWSEFQNWLEENGLQRMPY
ncbi:ankyrin repeat domain-containing protein [Nitratireductor sp. GZWM139]|uniref:ankyrin repeat domain-containing protein n=1 Tax=Nitratireductor sp. GZWM139 TaxID=2950541 RepID=UPI0024BE8238|nr:ankyrin repeat domain-containing protein [Nitratireductor sp. GZWM139]MDJ1463719.1 ankyrin repeat domain-containing protein [Nitratireductor sp. GZWM139]